MWNVEEIRRRGAYHEAAHAVVDVVLGRTVRYVSIETEGTDYRDTWQEITTDCEDIEELGDPDALESDTMKVREYCEAAARFGQMVKMPASDELPEGAPALPQMPSTGREAPWCHPGHSNPSSEPSPV